MTELESLALLIADLNAQVRQLQAENADYLPTDSNAGVQDRANALRAIDKLVKLAGAVILGHVLRIDGAPALQRLLVAGKGCEFQG